MSTDLPLSLLSLLLPQHAQRKMDKSNSLDREGSIANISMIHNNIVVT